MNWLFVSVGAGRKNFEEAAERLVSQASKSGFFWQSRSILTEELNQLIPELNARLFDKNGEPTPGYGFYSWKSRIAKLSLQGKFGFVDGIVLVDAGCEFFISHSSICRLNTYLISAQDQGIAAFAISTPEAQFTKKSLFDYFQTVQSDDYSPQFQSGILIIHRKKGLEIVNKWDEIVWDDIHNVDDSSENERNDYYAHRHDQSVLSLVLKSFGVLPIPENPPGLTKGFFQSVKAFSFPIWWSRNRSGESQIPFYLYQIGQFTQKFLKKSSWLRRK